MALRVRGSSIVWTLVLSCLLIAGLAPAGATAARQAPAPIVDTSAPAPRSLAGTASAPLRDAYGAVPLAFEPNRGQTYRRVAFLSHGPGYALFLTPTQAVLNVVAPRHIAPDPRAATEPITGTVLRLSLVGANPLS